MDMGWTNYISQLERAIYLDWLDNNVKQRKQFILSQNPSNQKIRTKLGRVLAYV